MVVRTESIGPTQCGITEATMKCTEGGCKPDNSWRMPGAGLSRLIVWKGTAWKASFPAVLGKTRRTE